GFDCRFFLGADRLDLFLDLFHIRRPSHRVDARPRARFVHDIDGLIRQESAGNISIGKSNGCFQRLVGKLGFVMGLVLRAQAFQNLNRKEHEEALKTYRELAQKEPETYLPEVAQTLNNLGIVDSAQNRAEEARKAFEEALKIYRELEQQNPGTYL